MPTRVKLRPRPSTLLASSRALLGLAPLGLVSLGLVSLGLALLGGCDTIATQLGAGPAFVVLDDAHGISIGHQVRVHGVTVGRVSDVSVADDGAHVTFQVDDSSVLHADACGEVRRDGLAGEAYLHIEAGHEEGPWEAPLRACESPTMEAAIAQTTGLIEELRRYVETLERGERTLCTVTTTGTAPAPSAVAPTPPTAAEATAAEATDEPAAGEPAAAPTAPAPEAAADPDPASGEAVRGEPAGLAREP